jgi:hypothetical protein
MESSMPGPDGFPLSRSDRLYTAHLLLNDYLTVEGQRDPERTSPDLEMWKKLPKRQLIDQIEALLRRLDWLYQHDADLENAHLARLRLTRLLRLLYTRKLPCTEPDLRMMLGLTVPLLGAIAPYGPVEYVMEYLKKEDLTPELCRSLREFQASLREEMSQSQASMQSLRQCLHMLLWLDEWEPLDPARCWSECIRRDFRAMTGDRRVRWRRLLKHIRGNVPPRMPAGWAREAEPRLADVGMEDFREQLSLWFAPFRSGQPLPLSVAGSHVLRGLIWYAALSRDEQVKECALWLLDVKWRQKRNTEKSMVALEVFGISKEELRSRSLIKQEVPSPAPRIAEKLNLMIGPTSGINIAADADGELIVVQGQLHFYRLFRSTGRIERASDNAVLELNWPAIPDQFRLSLRRECDSYEQLMLRATLLIHDSIFGHYFTVK